MATETLGRRIIDTAVRYKEARGNADKWDAWDDLKALAARADAAERLAVASERYIATIDGDRDWATGTDSGLNEALAAWRELGEVLP